MSVITTPDDAAVDVADEGQQSLIKRITSLQSVWILGVLLVIVAFFTVTAGGKFFSTSNFSRISQNIAVCRSRGGDDLRHHHVGHRPVGRIGTRLLISCRSESDGGDRRRRLGNCCHRHSGPARHRSPLGSVEWILDSQGEDPTADCDVWERSR